VEQTDPGSLHRQSRAWLKQSRNWHPAVAARVKPNDQSIPPGKGICVRESGSSPGLAVALRNMGSGARGWESPWAGGWELGSRGHLLFSETYLVVCLVGDCTCAALHPAPHGATARGLRTVVRATLTAVVTHRHAMNEPNDTYNVIKYRKYSPLAPPVLESCRGSSCGQAGQTSDVRELGNTNGCNSDTHRSK
jgi:hypothetical protein